MVLRSLKVGISVSLSGQFRVQGAQALAGLSAWAGYINQRGGVQVGSDPPPLPVTVVHHDDASASEGARAVTKRLITEDRVDLLFGPYSAALIDAAAEVSEEHGRVLWNQGGASDSVYRRGHRLVVGILTPATEYLAGLLPLVRGADSKASSVVVLRASTGGFPRAVSESVERRAGELGFRVELIREFPASISDFRPILDEVARVQPDLLLCVGRIQNDLLFATQLAQRTQRLKAAAVVAAPNPAVPRHIGNFSGGFHRPQPVGTVGQPSPRLRPACWGSGGLPHSRRSRRGGLSDGAGLRRWACSATVLGASRNA